MDLNKPHYFIEDGEFVFSAACGKIRMGSQVSLMFSWNDLLKGVGTLYKHGRPEDVEKACKKLRKGLSDRHLKRNIRMITVTSEFPLEELNRFLNISGYIGIFLTHPKVLGGKLGENYFMEQEEKANEHT